MAFPSINTAKGKVSLPCMEPVMVPIDKVQANDYNPNKVSKAAMKLLLQSILDNGFCFPVVTVYDSEADRYIIVDGFHRYTIFKDYLKAEEIPVVVLEQDLKQRMASTIQFNRARGVHQTELMADLVKAAIAQGSSETDLTKHMGMDLEEVFRLEQQAGIAEQFKDYPWSKSWIIENLEEK